MQSELLRAGANGEAEIRLVRASDEHLAEMIDLATDATAKKRTRGPSNRVFNESLEITATDLEALFKELIEANMPHEGKK